MTEHPITPPPELMQQLWDDFNGAFYEFEAITATVFQAGADQELEACCEWIPKWTPWDADRLRAARRPKPPSLKEQALALINHDPANQPFLSDKGIDTIRRALEQLDD